MVKLSIFFKTLPRIFPKPELQWLSVYFGAVLFFLTTLSSYKTVMFETESHGIIHYLYCIIFTAIFLCVFFILGEQQA